MTGNKRHSKFYPLMLAMIILFFLILIPIGMTQVSAAEADAPEMATVRIESKTVHRGQTFELQIYLDHNPGLVSLMLELEYDKTAMKLVGVSHGDALSTHSFTTTNTETEEGFSVTPFRMLWDGRAQDKSTGVLVTLTFESKVDAEIGNYPVTVIFDRENTNAEYGVPCEVQIENGSISLTKGAYTVKYYNYDGTLLYEKDYSESTVPSYNGSIPTRPTDTKYSYEFLDWKGMVSDTPNVICYEAVYKLTPQIYQVFFYVDGEYFNAFECEYGEFVDLTQLPSKKNHIFDGWYADESLTQRVTAIQMADHNLTLYGQMKFNIRENPAPEIKLSLDRIEGDYAYIAVDVTQNPSLSGLVLTLDYDKSALTFEGFERGDAFSKLLFDHTNTDQGYSADQFKFYWEHTVNTTDTGRILVLKFKISREVPSGVYTVNMTYDQTTDAVYINELGEISYTKLNITGANIPVGELYYWNEEIEDVADIVVECPEGMPADTELRIEVVTANMDIPDEFIKNEIASHMELKSVYTVELLRNEIKVQPSGTLTVRIKLTDAQMHCTDLRVYHVDDENVFTFYESRIEDGYIIFETNHLSYWAIIGNAAVVDSNADSSMPTNSPIVIIAFALLAISCMAFCLILIAQKKGWMTEKSNKKGEDNT